MRAACHTLPAGEEEGKEKKSSGSAYFRIHLPFSRSTWLGRACAGSIHANVLQQFSLSLFLSGNMEIPPFSLSLSVCICAERKDEKLGLLRYSSAVWTE
ncbi:hypothetical protein CDAR_496361 [Caerostris darwini]|uniref:Uncharacterized protein n=1 Tax=Caerostris darwini TaxID=1538125 RepID=A0AAV4MUN2_9ARAC|nr:hypothetical protein CDAR_496361 [Caerostris darwini]